MAQIEQEASAAQGLETGTIRIGSFPSASARLLPKIVRVFEKQHPQITMVLFEGTDQEVSEWLQDRVIDVGFAAQSTLGPDMTPLTKDTMAAVLPKGHVLSEHDSVSIESLVDHPFIMSTGGCEPLIVEEFGQSQCGPSIKFAVRDMDTILNIVGAGNTIVPALSLPDTTPRILVKNLHTTMWGYLGLRCPFINEATPAVRSFVALAQSLFHGERALS